MVEDLKIESIIDSVAEKNKHEIQNGKKRLAKFLKIFNQEFPKGDIFRAPAEALTWALYDSVISLYANGNNSFVIMEIHSILEKYSIRDLPIVLTENKIVQSIIKDLIDRKNLSNIAVYFGRLDVWSKTDLKYVERLARIRNGIAHKNEKLISKAINSGNETHHLDIESIVNELDTCELIITSIKLCVKLQNV